MKDIIENIKRKRVTAKGLSTLLIAINDLAWEEGFGEKVWKSFHEHYKKPKKGDLIEAKKLYNKIAKFYGTEKIRKRLLEIEDRAVRGLLPRKGKVFDAGCGNGRHSIQLAKRGCEVVGIDLSKEMLKEAKKKSRGLNIKYRLGDIRKLKFKNNTFDHSVSMLVLNHLKDWKKAVQEIVRVTKPGGTILMAYIHPKRFEGKKTKEYIFSKTKGKLWIKDYRITLSELKNTVKCKLIKKKEVSNKKFAKMVMQKELDSPILMIVKFLK